MKTVTPEMRRLQNRARAAVGSAIRAGRMVKPDTCERCKKVVPPSKPSRLQGHHYLGYDHPLDVEWLCTMCHHAETPSNPSRGVEHGLAKLTPEAVKVIRLRQQSQRKLAERFGVSRKLIHDVQKREIWLHV